MRSSRTGGGRFTEPVSLQKPDETKRNDYGEIDYADDSHWTTRTSRLAYVLEGPGRESTADDQVHAEVSHRVGLPADSVTRVIPPDWRILWNDGGTLRRLQIVGRRRLKTAPDEIELACLEAVL